MDDGFLMDPYYMPDDLDGDQKYDALLGIEWLDVANEVLKDFYQDDIEAHRAELEFLEAIKKQRRWGKHVQKIKNSLKLPEGKQYDFEVEKVITKQKLMRSTRYAWDLVGSKQFPRIKDIGIRLSVLAVQSANVERVCKVHGVVHTKSRNRLTLSRVIKLIFCYVNLRLLQKEKTKLVEFLEDSLSAEQQEIVREQEEANKQKIMIPEEEPIILELKDDDDTSDSDESEN